MRENFAIIGKIDPAPLLAKLSEHPEIWDMEQERQRHPGSPHAQAQAIFLRWAERRELYEDRVQAVFRDLDAVDYPASKILMPEAGVVTRAVLSFLGDMEAEIGRVMITKLPPKGRITAHMDEGLYADHYDRFHVCLQGDAGNLYYCGGTSLNPAPGDAFWFNHKLTHHVENQGDVNRIHLILDIVAPAYRAKRGVYCQAEFLSDFWHEAQPLFAAHWREIAHYQDIELAPDQEFYFSQEQVGNLRCYTARDSGRLVGYVVFFVRRNPHYMLSRQAAQDVLFLLPEYRRGMTGVRLLRLAEERLKAEAVQVVYHHVKRTNKVGELLERLGYEPIDVIFGKRLDR